MNECNECNRYVIDNRNHTVSCGFYHGGFCHATDRGTEYPRFEIEVFVRNLINNEVIEKFGRSYRGSPTTKIEVWVNDELVSELS